MLDRDETVGRKEAGTHDAADRAFPPHQDRLDCTTLRSRDLIRNQACIEREIDLRHIASRLIEHIATAAFFAGKMGADECIVRIPKSLQKIVARSGLGFFQCNSPMRIIRAASVH